MAKKQNGGKNGGNGGGGNKGNSIKGPECAAASTANREAARKEEARRAAARNEQKATGEFFLARNDGREVDIFKLEDGRIGQYAIPGGDKPSAHLRVSDIGTPDRPFVVIYYEGAHDGSGLAGNLSKETILPVSLLSRQFFLSRKDGIQGETQNAVWKFLTGQIDKKRAEMEEAAGVRLIESLYAKSDKDLRGIKREELGQYGIQKDGGIAIFQVFRSGKAVAVSVLKSTIPNLVESPTFVPVYLFDREELVKVTDQAIYDRQNAIFKFLKPIMDNLPEDESYVAPKATVHVFSSPAAPTIKPKTDVSTTSVKAVMKGATGVAIFEADDKSATIKVYDKQTGRGTQRLFEVIEMSGFAESSVLSIEVGTTVTAEQLIAGKLEKSETAALPPKSAGAKFALISFIEKSIKTVRFCKRPSEAILPKALELKQAA